MIDFSFRLTFKLFRCFGFLIYLFQTCKAQTVSVFTENEFKGSRTEVEISTCFNLQKPWVSNVSSINTQGQCAHLYDSMNCTGNHIEILKRSPSHNILSGWDFDKKSVSIGPCLDSCSTEVTGRLFDETVIVDIFTEKYFQGTPFNIIVNGCTPVPKYFVNRTHFINTNGHCVQLYNTEDCKVNATNGDTIELRRGTPSHSDLGTWFFPQTKSISHCNYKCFQNKRFQLPLDGEIFLFYSKFYGGKFIQLNDTSGNCIGIDSGLYGPLESIQIGKNTSLSLFQRRKCKGLQFVVNKSVPYLALLALNWIPLSFKVYLTKTENQLK